MSPKYYQRGKAVDHKAVHLVPEGENTHYRIAMDQRAIDLIL